MHHKVLLLSVLSR